MAVMPKNSKRPLKVELRHRMNAGRVAVEAQVETFERLFGNVTSEWKHDQTRVTFADYAISEKLITQLRESFPHDDFCTEEAGAEAKMDLSADFAWVLDPIDGTNNYALGIPLCAISVGLLYKGNPAYGFVYDYARRELLEGGPGLQLTANGRPVQPQHKPFDNQSICAVHYPLPEAAQQALATCLAQTRMRSLGSSTLQLAWSATGLLDGCIDYGVRVWDIAAACALVASAGASIHYLANNPFPLKHFTTQAPKVAFYAGSDSFCSYVAQQLGDTPRDPEKSA
jgi:myo-inositol-1(or 4)-monophosphatase